MISSGQKMDTTKSKIRQMKYIVLIVCLLVNYSVFVQAQITQVSDQDVELEGLFIEANREKLIGNFEKADSLYQLMLKRDRNNDAIYFELARVQLKLNKDQEALKFIKKAIELEPTNEWYALFLAEVHEKMGDETQAANVYQNLTITHPNDRLYYEKWAFHLVKANKVLDAVEVYNRLEKLSGISEELTRKKHLLYVGLGDNKKAAKELQALVDTYPKHLEYQYTLASFYQQIGETAKANLVFQNILKKNPNDTKAKLALQTPDGSQGLSAQLPVFQRKDVSIDLKIKQLIPVLQKVVSNSDKALAEEALPLAIALIEAHPQEAKAYAVYADLLYYSGQRQAARKAYEDTIELDESVYTVWEQLLYILQEERDFPALKKTSETALELFPNQTNIYLMNGLALDELDLKEEAVEILQEALLVAGNNISMQQEIQTYLGKIHAELGADEVSNRAFESALKLNPNNAKTLAFYAYALAQRSENLEQAKKMATEANRLQPNQTIVEHALGWVYYKLNDLKNSKIWLEKAASNAIEAVVVEHYGDMLFRLGQTEEALSQWQRARTLGGKSELLNKKIAERKLYE